MSPLASAHLEALRAATRRGAAASAADREQILAKARLLLVDTAGCVLSGRSSPQVRAFEASLAGLDPGQFTFPGGPGLSASAAASLAAMASAWDEGCEGLPYAHGRPGLALIGALLATGVVRRLSIGRILESLVAGYEVGARAGGWLRIAPDMHVDGNWPAIGVAAGVGHLLELSPALRWNAVAMVACQLPASLYLPIRTGDDARNTYPAHAAVLGMQAALASAAGISAPEQAIADYARHRAHPDGRPAPAQDRWFILESYFKPHAGVRHAHYGLEAALSIRQRLNSQTRSICRVRLRVYPEATIYAGNRNPHAPITAQFSLSLGVAAGLRFGAMDPDLFRDERLNDPELRRLEQLVDIEPVPEWGQAQQRAAHLQVETSDGAVFEHSVDTLPGSPERPLTAEQVVEKFVRYSASSLNRTSAERFCSAVLHAAEETDFASVWHELMT